jgi:magnesium chelatase subunit H
VKSVVKNNSKDERDANIFALYEQLVEIEQRLIPRGLHVFGRPSSAGEKTDLLKMIASFDRPETGARAIPDELLDDAVREFMANGIEAAVAFLEQKGLPAETTRPVFTLLETVSTKLKTNNEIDSLVRALRGEFIEPGPGADIIQNPDILPTGRNTHAINPYGVPSAAAYARSEAVANSLLERHQHENGRYPEAMALVLWGLDNIKTQGEGVAQALWLLGTRPVRDALNRSTSVEAIPLSELGRPRIDVVMTVSGIFRDLFSPTVQLLDKAVRLVAQLDEPLELNYVRKHVLLQVEEDRCDADDAAVRVFSNAPGNYGTNVNFMVMDSQWESEETLGDLFVTRKCFAYGRDSKGRAIEGREGDGPGAFTRRGDIPEHRHVRDRFD